MTQNVLYTAKIRTTGGRDGVARSNDGTLDLKLSPPGSGRPGTNPEQLLAAGWSACFIGAMRRVAGTEPAALPADTAVYTEIDLISGDEGFRLQARLTISLPGIDAETAQRIVAGAHQTCPYSKATRGNIDVTFDIAR